MMYAKKIRMQNGCRNSNNTQEIAEIYVDGCNNPGFFPKAVPARPDKTAYRANTFPNRTREIPFRFSPMQK